MIGWLRRRLFGRPDLAGCTLIDVRSDAEFAAGSLPGALSLPLDRLQQEARACLPDTSARLVVFCQSGLRSAIARRQLIALGYRDVANGGSQRRLAARLARQRA